MKQLTKITLLCPFSYALRYEYNHEKTTVQILNFCCSLLLPSMSSLDSLQQGLIIIMYFLCFGAITKSLVRMVDAVYAITQTSVQIIIFSIPVIDQQKIHVHPLTFFPRQNSLICNVCGLIEKYATYVCLRCNFVAHRDCMYSPHTIKISRHHHRISHVSSIRYGKFPCGVCRQSIDGDYGAYTCNKCGDYAVHSRCALGKDVWDGEELEGIPEKDEDDITQDAPPFSKISKGLIHYFLHDHHLRLEENILYDENKLCEACVMPIFEDKLYSCTECDFILHETCLKARRRIQHALHLHLLILKTINNVSGDFRCDACWRSCGGFVYQCPKEECDFKLDVRCASISEPFDYQGHEHPMFLSLDPEKKLLCEVSKNIGMQMLNCIKCDFIVCMECSTLPYKARYKSDKHFLTLSW
ncbi:BnaC01g29790D [Brassica napus]|uniref:(rape) hypothetical protein n=1 Tax=Brassica napus TaxID=3708 RepID=A0A078GFR4_BRANA|nr:unnamed protein product [Brassica napus]CDY25310.1 BnaC01g29790D [Brassica napus]